MSSSTEQKHDPDYETQSLSVFPPTAPTGGGILHHLDSHKTNFSETKVNIFAGALAGLASSLITCPLDVVKTRLQAQNLSTMVGPYNYAGGVEYKPYHGSFNSLQRIWYEEGIRGLYRGLGPLIIGYLPTWATYFGLYENCKKVYGERFPAHQTFTHIASAMTAGICSTLITNPIWVVKTRLMTQNVNSNNRYRSTLDAFSRMYREEGIRVFYSGLIPSLLGTVHVAVQFPLYEKFKQVFSGISAHEPTKSSSSSSLTRYSTTTIILASVLSKIAASFITYPHEVVRTRLQNQKGGSAAPGSRYTSILQTITTVYREEGWRSFYSGMGTNMIRTVPSSAITLLTFELVSTHLKNWQADFDIKQEL